MYEADQIKDFKLNQNTGAVEIIYKNGKKFQTTPATMSMNPIKRIPLFNILKSDHPLKAAIEEYFQTYLGWFVKFFDTKHIDQEEEAKQWRKNLGMSLGKMQDVTSGTKSAGGYK